MILYVGEPVICLSFKLKCYVLSNKLKRFPRLIGSTITLLVLNNLFQNKLDLIMIAEMTKFYGLSTKSLALLKFS